MNVYVREDEWEVVHRDVVDGKTAEPNAHQCAAILGDRSVRKERTMWIPTAPKHRFTRGGSSDCPFFKQLHDDSCMTSERCPTSLVFCCFCPFVSSSKRELLIFFSELPRTAVVQGQQPASSSWCPPPNKKEASTFPA